MISKRKVLPLLLLAGLTGMSLTACQAATDSNGDKVDGNKDSSLIEISQNVDIENQIEISATKLVDGWEEMEIDLPPGYEDATGVNSVPNGINLTNPNTGCLLYATATDVMQQKNYSGLGDDFLTKDILTNRIALTGSFVQEQLTVPTAGGGSLEMLGAKVSTEGQESVVENPETGEQATVVTPSESILTALRVFDTDPKEVQVPDDVVTDLPADAFDNSITLPSLEITMRCSGGTAEASTEEFLSLLKSIEIKNVKVRT